MSEEFEYLEEEKPARNFFKNNKLIITIAIVAIVIIAAVKNPSKSEADAEIKSIILEKVNERARQDIELPSGSEDAQMLGSAIINFLTTGLVDNCIETEVSNYLLFSTFDAKVFVGDYEESLVSGFIIFGYVIPTKIDMGKD